MYPVSTSILCERCKVLEFDDSSIGRQLDTEAGTHHLQVTDDRVIHLDYELEDLLPDLPSLTLSSQSGCDFCSMLIAAIRECNFDAQELFATLEFRTNSVYAGQECKETTSSIRAVVACLTLASLEGEDSEAFLMFTVDGPPGKATLRGISDIIYAHSFMIYCKSKVSNKLAYRLGPCSDWLSLQSSPEEDPLCAKNMESLRSHLSRLDDEASKDHARMDYSPSRLINVDPHMQFDCKLEVPGVNGEQAFYKYAALSYCWGTSEDAEAQFKTEIDTLTIRQKGFMLHEASAVMRDAIKVTRALGVRYLWVDALCIIQDDKEDWEKESAEMARVYQNAYITICAAASESCRESFLDRSRLSARVHFQSQIKPNVSGIYYIRWHSVIWGPHVAEQGYDRQDSHSCRWARRGWTYQEEKLSRRALVFGKGKLHLFCNEMHWEENEEEGDPYIPLAYDSSTVQRLDDETLSGWLYSMDDYSERELGRAIDKLPAIAGLAGVITDGEPTHYVAGLRRDKIHRDLMWGVTDMKYGWPSERSKCSIIEKLQKPEPFIAPSWSWASRDFELCQMQTIINDLFHGRSLQRFRKEFDMLEAKVVVSGLNPFGQISHGSCTFIGQIRPLCRPLRQPERPAVRLSLWEYHDTDFFAFVVLDWDSYNDDEPFQNLSFLLLGSCDGYKYDKVNSSKEDINSTDISRHQGNNKQILDNRHNEIGLESMVDANEDGHSKSNSKLGPLYIFDHGREIEVDHETNVLGQTLYSRITDRYAYGLIIHSCPEPGKAFRVGIWASGPYEEHVNIGGLNYFRGHGKTTMELI